MNEQFAQQLKNNLMRESEAYNVVSGLYGGCNDIALLIHDYLKCAGFYCDEDEYITNEMHKRMQNVFRKLREIAKESHECKAEHVDCIISALSHYTVKDYTTFLNRMYDITKCLMYRLFRDINEGNNIDYAFDRGFKSQPIDMQRNEALTVIGRIFVM
jgi:hypothetical protein